MMSKFCHYQEDKKLKKYRRIMTAVLVMMLAAGLVAGCSQKEEEPVQLVLEKIPEDDPALKPKPVEPEPVVEEVVEEEVEETMEVPEGMYLSELTGLPISEDLRDQRPVAVMVDNEKIALDHFETAECDIVYEIMNSTANDRVTRLMCIRKDWKPIQQMGSIRSTRPTNIPLAAEYNAVLVHDGGPFYINDWLARSYARHLTGGFARIKNGKNYEFTEYITNGELESRMKAAGYSETYDSAKPERDTHFIFGEYGTDYKLSETDYATVKTAKDIKMPVFKHNQSELKYNESTGTYDYYEYGSIHQDGEDGEPLSFKNVLLQNTTFSQLDENGYLIYNMINTGDPRKGYYITNGECVNVTWLKDSETAITKFFDENGDEIIINPGKTYIGLIPSDGWDSVSIQ